MDLGRGGEAVIESLQKLAQRLTEAGPGGAESLDALTGFCTIRRPKKKETGLLMKIRWEDEVLMGQTWADADMETTKPSGVADLVDLYLRQYKKREMAPRGPLVRQLEAAVRATNA